MTLRDKFFTTAPHRRRISRRQLLYAAGALGGGSLLLPSLMSKKAAAEAAGIKRLVIFTSAHQIMPAGMHMRRGNEPETHFEYRFSDVPNAEFSNTLAPLAGHKERLTVIEGLSLTSAMVNTGYTNNHDTAHGNLLTGAGVRIENGDSVERDTLGPSVDQVIAQGVKHPDRIPSLELGTSSGYLGGFCSFGENDKTPITLRPGDLYDRLFPNPGDLEPTEESRIHDRRGSVLSMLDDEYAHVAPRLGGKDREKLENHRQMIADLQRRISGLQGLGCSAPGGEDEWLTSTGGSKRDKVRQFAKVIGAAFACDMTRVATIQVSQLANEEFNAPPGDVHQDFAHQSKDNDSAEAEMRKYNRVYAEMFASLCDELSAYSDEAGNLLDSTLVVWMSEHGITRDAHTLTEHPAVMVGNLGGHFDVGRYISVPRQQVHPKEEKGLVGSAHNHFLVSLMQGMGLTDDSINLREYQTNEGRVIPLTGPLPEFS